MFGQKLKAWREKYGISQEELARQLGITQQAVANWELGIRHPKKRFWKKLISLTNGEITLDDFLELGSTEDLVLPRKTAAGVK